MGGAPSPVSAGLRSRAGGGERRARWERFSRRSSTRAAGAARRVRCVGCEPIRSRRAAGVAPGSRAGSTNRSPRRESRWAARPRGSSARVKHESAGEELRRRRPAPSRRAPWLPPETFPAYSGFARLNAFARRRSRSDGPRRFSEPSFLPRTRRKPALEIQRVSPPPPV